MKNRLTRLYSILFKIFFVPIFLFNPAHAQQTFCNPLNLNYRFMNDAEQAREAADPVIVLYKDNYYLFASRSGGYWTSADLHNWTFIEPVGLNIIETYAPAVMVLRDTLFYAASANGQTFKSADPQSGFWTAGPAMGSYGDPDFFVDDDGRLYMYYGLSNSNPTSVVELDPFTFAEIGNPVNIVYNQASIHGWERRGDDNLLDEVPWIEGSWMTKDNGKYYLQYSAPGTEFKTYADGIYVADSPLGPYVYADYSPFSFKPTGFITGAGHGSTFIDKKGQYWRVLTMVISVKHIFERRLGIYPVSFAADGQMRCNTAFADYPQYLPGLREDPVNNNFAGMVLLSHKKFVTSSTALDGYGPENAVDEESRTYWSARSGDPGEWLLMDLGAPAAIEAVQVNFAEHDTDPLLVRGRNVQLMQKYRVETSPDGQNWHMLIDKSQNTADVPHDYTELGQTVQARYVRLTNVYMPGNGKFAVRGLRVFGNSQSAVYTMAEGVQVERDEADGRDAVIRWNPVAEADGYIIRYGIAADKLYNNYMVYDSDSVAIHSLNHGVDYYFEVQAFDSGLEYYKSAGTYRTGQSGDWNDINSWQQYNGLQWLQASSLPDSGEAIVIRQGHTITLTENDTVSQTTVASGATLLINEGITLSVAKGLGIDLRVNGTLVNYGSVLALDSARIMIDDGGVYNHAQPAGTLPLLLWGSGSVCHITG